MSKTFRKKRLVASLPTTLCTPEMREKMTKIASDKGVSIGEVQREAFSLFLRENDSFANKSIAEISNDSA